MRRSVSVNIYIDGSSLYNTQQSVAAWSYTILKKHGDKIVNWDLATGLINGTSNRAELTAAIEALKLALTINYPTTIFSDSKYVVTGVTKGLRRWSENEWKSGRGYTIANVDLWQILFILYQNRPNICWKHVKAHSGILGNEIADLACTVSLRSQKALELTGVEDLTTLLTVFKQKVA